MKAKTIYNNDTFYTDAPPEVEKEFARVEVVDDFLPSPDELVFRTNDEIMVSIDSNSLAFFRRYAQKKNTSYQNIISNVLQKYALQHAKML